MTYLMTKEELEGITKKVNENNPMGVSVDRKALLEAHYLHLKAFEAIVKVLVHGRSVAADMQEAVRLAQEQLGRLPTVVGRDCTTDPEE